MEREQRLSRYFEVLAQTPALAEPGGPLRLVLDRAAMERFEDSGPPLGVLVEDAYVLVLRDLVENEEGLRFGYLRILNRRALSGNAGVVILPVVRGPGEDEVALVRIFRHALRGWALELPRGFAEPHESGPETARRELREETGLHARSVELLGHVEPDSGLMHNPAAVYLAAVERGETGPSAPEATEAITRVERWRLPALQQAVAEGRIRDGFTLAALALARARGALAG